MVQPLPCVQVTEETNCRYWIIVNELSYITDALDLWADSYPRRIGRSQDWVANKRMAAVKLANYEEDDWEWPFISTYSFPRGHSSENEIPHVDRLFIDFDYPDEADGFGARSRRQQLSELLVRTRRVAQYLLDEGRAAPFQAVLSGKKGVHLDVVFPAIDPGVGTFPDFKVGLTNYSENLVTHLKEQTGLDDLDKYIDVNSSDLGRLRRVPNTLHRGAQEAVGEPRYCVPVSITELAEIGPDEYAELTSARREVTEEMGAEPSVRAAESIAHQIRSVESAAGFSFRGGSTVDKSRISEYKENSNDGIGLEELDFVFSRRPCITEYLERDDVFQHRDASHLFEMFCITHMMDRDVPIDTMVAFFEEAGGEAFNEKYTRRKIRDYISRDYNPVNCETVIDRAEMFCAGERCDIYEGIQADE